MEYAAQRAKEIGLKLTRGVATSVQVFEWLSIVLIAWTFLFQKIDNFALLAPKLYYAIYGVGYFILLLIIVIGSLIADFLKWTQNTSLLSFAELGNFKTGLIVGILYIAVAGGFIVGEQEMIKDIGTTHFGVPKDTSKYTDDKNYTLRLSEKDKSEKEYKDSKARIEKSVCSECLTITSNYAKTLATWNNKRAKTEADRKYINSNISSIERKRNAEVETAKAKHEALKAQKLEQLEQEYNTEFKEVKTAVQTITSRIDSAKNKNDLDIILREKKIKAIAVGTSIFTILIQFVCRFFAFFILRDLQRLNELFDENNPLLDFLNTFPVVGKYFDDNFWAIKFKTNKAGKEANKIKYDALNDQNQRMKIRRNSKYLKWIKEHNYTDNFLTSTWFTVAVWNGEIDEDSNNAMTMAYEDKKNNPHKTVSIPLQGGNSQNQQSNISQNNLQNNAQNTGQTLGNLSEKDIILGYISDSELAILGLDPNIDSSEIQVLNDIISDCQLAILGL